MSGAMSGASWLSVQQFAEMAGVSHKTIRGMIDRGELPAHRLGRLIRIDPEEARAVTVYRPTATDVAEPPRRRRREVRGDYSRRAREVG